MEILKKLLRDRSQFAEIPDPPPTISVGAESSDDDTEEEPSRLSEPEGLGSAEGQTFYIEYKDANGKKSTRSITVWGITANASCVPILTAKCHLRNTNRSFRIDRILEIIDLDGVYVDDIPAFLQDNFGMNSEFANFSGQKKIENSTSKKKTPTPSEIGNWPEQRKFIRPFAVLWILLAQSDGWVQDSEVNAASKAFEDLFGSKADTDRFEAYFKRLRPSDKQVYDAMDHFRTIGQMHSSQLVEGCRQILNADGVIHSNEVKMIKVFADALRS